MEWSGIFGSTVVICLYLALQVKGQRPIFPNLPNPRIVIIGPTGSGKSSLANALLGCDPSLDDCMFEVCDDVNSCTKTTTYGTGPWLGKGQNFTVVDTPGFSDTNDEDDALVEEMMDILSKDVKHADTILLLLKGTETIFNKGLEEMMKRMTLMFGSDWWDYVLVGVSFWPYDEFHIEKRKCDPEYPEECNDESWYAGQSNGQIHENFGIEKNFTFIFTDSWSQVEGPPHFNSEDPLQQEHWQIETGILWNITTSRDQNFAFMTINDFMEENARQKAEIKWLNDVIMNNITALAAQIEDNTGKISDNSEADKNLKDVVNHAVEDITELGVQIMDNTGKISDNTRKIADNTGKISDNTGKIADNSEADKNLKDVVNHAVEDITELGVQIMDNAGKISDNTGKIAENTGKISDNTGKIADNSEADNNLKEVVDHVIENVSDVNGKSVMNEIHIQTITTETLPDLLPPIGSIIAWIPSPNNEGEYSAVPEGWQKCDGSTITKGIYKDLKTPNLNGEGRFLRGGNDAKATTLEKDMFQDHEHTFSDYGHSHDDQGHTHTDRGHNHYTMGSTIKTSDDQCQIYILGDKPVLTHYFCGTFRSEVEGKANIESSKANIATESTGITVGKAQDGYRHGTETRPKNMNVIYIMRIC